MTGGGPRLRVPVGEDAERWVTRVGCRRVLFVVHNVTSATRLLDVLPLFAGDLRVQMFATCTGSSPFLAGVPELLARAGLPVLPWEQAKDTTFDLAVAASYGGELGAIQGKLAVLSHGVGYNKRLATLEHRDIGDARPPVFGLSPQWLLEDGRPLATATVLSHPEQLDRLRSACPEAASTAALAGDPCHDRILAALPRRDLFRRALGVEPGQRLIVVSSTWAPRSLFGGEPGTDDLLPWLLSRLTAELPADEYRSVAVLHPNIWYGHGPGQVRAWLDHARRAGLDAIGPLDGWRQALIAADCVLGDHSSVTYYAASVGTPVLLGAFPEEDLDPLSPVAALGRTAPRLLRRGGLRAQIDRAIASHAPDRYKDLAEQTSSSPGESAALLRRLFYGLMDVPEPGHPALLDPLPLPPYRPARRTAPIRVLVGGIGTDPPDVALVRYASSVTSPTLPRTRRRASTPPTRWSTRRRGTPAGCASPTSSSGTRPGTTRGWARRRSGRRRRSTVTRTAGWSPTSTGRTAVSCARARGTSCGCPPPRPPTGGPICAIPRPTPPRCTPGSRAAGPWPEPPPGSPYAPVPRRTA